MVHIPNGVVKSRKDADELLNHKNSDDISVHGNFDFAVFGTGLH